MLKPSLEHCIWLKEENLAFIYIPKVACTSWKIFLWQLMGNELTPEITYKSVHNGQILALPYVNNMPEESRLEFSEGVESGGIQCCAMIREPKSRVLSGYLDKVLNHKNPNSSFSLIILPVIRKYHGLEKDQRPTFLEFLEWNKSIKEEQGHDLNDHWRQMTEIIGIEDESIDQNKNLKLWTMTQLDEAEEWFQERLMKKIRFPSSQSLGPRPINNSKEKIASFYGKNEIDIYKRIYSSDEKLYRLLAP